MFDLLESFLFLFISAHELSRDIYIYEMCVWMHNDECIKGLERHKTGMFNEYVRKHFENARSYK